jgi:exopolyphosphatase / guanosine-5'-triphosphate,3'-diphosphate pyrophosphatase
MMDKAREISVKEVMKKFEREPSHAEQVAKLALIIFDRTKGLIHNFSDNDRDLLEAGALLHDIGYYISAAGHHKIAMMLIDDEKMPGFSAQEKEIVANITRYHKGKLPKKKHERYSRLSDADKTLVKRLGAFLRIADALDRSHSNIVSDLEASFDSFYNNLTLCLKLNTPNCSAEMLKAEQKKDLFEKEFGIEVKFITG